MLMFAQIRASTVAAASTEALPVSVRRKLRSGVSIRRTQAVFWENGPPVSSLTSASSAAVCSAAAAAMSASETSMTLDASGDDSLIAAASQATSVDDAPQEAPGPFVRWFAEQPVGRRLFHDLPVGEETHPAGDVTREAHLMRGDQHRHPAFGQFPDHVQHVGHQLRVERAGDLVEQ